MIAKQVKEQRKAAPASRRSDRAHQAILQATLALLAEAGYRALTIEAIAARAGVGKKTIYRWWPSKAVVALEALITYANVEVPFLDTGSLKGDLLIYLERSFHILQGTSEELVRGLAAEAQVDPEFRQELQRVFVVPRRESLVAVLQRGVQRGELPAESNLDILADMIYGAKWYRFLLYPAPLDREFAEGLVQMILNLRK
jgi:AcrR family transcriptional regulator